VQHTGYVVSGRMHVVMDDGSEQEIGPGDFYVIRPEHDAWVMGEETYGSKCGQIFWRTPLLK
jgi:uncharacterized cupin superfamily protein